MKNKLLAITMLLMLLVSSMAITLPAMLVKANDGVLNVLFDQDVAWAHVKVEEFADSVKWTIDLDESSSYLNNPVAGIVVIIGIGSEIKFQVHNNDGVDPHYPYGTWLISYYESGWHTGSPDYKNYPLPDGITATGGRSKSENPQMIFTVIVGKAYLANEFKWAVYFKGGSGGRTFYPPGFSWGDTNTSDMATAKYLILGGAVASLAKARGTSEQYYWGSGCWAAVLGQKFEIYIDPTVPPFDALDGFSIDDIFSISYHTNKPGSQSDVDFYLVIYTKPDGVNDNGWYGYKLIGEPYFSRNLNAPSNQWNKWSTDVGTNQLTFFDPDTIGFYGFYGQPTLQDIQAGPINWHNYYSGCPVTNIDYGVEIVKYISFQTGTGWMNTFQGYIDAITIALKDGTTISIDLEGFASEIWVDDDWAGLPPGYEVEPGKFIGYNAFAKIQDAINAVTSEGTIIVYEGTYHENIVINKPLTLVSASLPIIDGGVAGDCISVSANNVVINGFEIRNGYNGIIGETDGSTFSNNIIHDNLNIPGYAGVGILLWGDNDNNLITGNEIYNNDRQGIFIGYSDTSKISTGNIISHNTIYNNGLYRYANGPDASAYGIQLWCADNNIIENNEVYGHDDWFPYGDTFDFAQGIYLCASFDNVIKNNSLHDNNYGVGAWSAGRTPVGSNKINYNNIAGNTGFGVRTFDTVTIDARFNWWGDASGPTHPSNSGGIGDKISDNVDYSPWLGDGFEVTPRTYHVNPAGAPSAIQEAINEASSGDTIIVHEGTYNEALYISKSLTIKGASTPVIKGSGTFMTNYMGAPWTREAVIFVVNSTDVVLESLDIEGENLGPGYNDGVVYVYSSGEIRNCIVSPNTIGDMYSLGVEARASDLKVIGTTIENFGRIGVYFANCTGGVYSSTIIGQVYSDANQVNYGIEIEPHQGVRGTIEVIGNEICNSDNTYLPEPTWSSAGIVIDAWKEYMDTPSSTVIIQHNNIHNNYYGIEVAANALSHANYNNIYNNREYGVISASDYLGNNATFDACYNWWGHETGPYHGTSWIYLGEPYGPHYGLGDDVSDYVLYYPWLSEQSGPPVQPPTASFTYSPAVPKAGEAVTFDASSSLPNGGTIIEYKWDFGDGNTTTTSNAIITHVYLNSNTYNITLTVTDSESLKDSTCKTITVVPAIQITIKVEPVVYRAKRLNETFSINIVIYNVTEEAKLVGFEFKLRYNSTLLKVIEVKNGTFLEAFAGPPNGGVLYFGPIITNDYILFAGLLLPDENGKWHEPFPSGNGTLATITFQVIYQPIGLENPIVSCNLTLFNTKLGAPGGIPISHSLEHGLYEIVPTPMGDLNFDGKTDIFDAIVFAASFGATPLDANWNPYADLYKDEIIDIFDAIIIGNHFGEQRPDP